MLSQLGLLDVRCDAPTYDVVCACKDIGFHTPMDVGWRRLSNYLDQIQRKSAFGYRLWRWLFGVHRPAKARCICGEPLPGLKEYEFAAGTSDARDYLLGQCRCCHTIFWDSAESRFLRGLR